MYMFPIKGHIYYNNLYTKGQREETENEAHLD